jgi:hypothetical protein
VIALSGCRPGNAPKIEVIMFRLLIAGISAALLVVLNPFTSRAQSPAELDRFTASNESSRTHIDYEVWTELLFDFVLNVPIMSRIPPRGRAVVTGTRISTANQSRYRYEANRVAYHLMSDEYKQAISFYREDLESLPDQIDFFALNRDEQLAYWFNLHNVAIIEQVMLNYPTSRIAGMEAHGSDENVFEAKILNVAGVALSLNDIRMRIVYENWDDPRVMYGFFNGSVGGPELRRNAFNGTRIWDQLDVNGREFVNSLRGVEVARSELRVSHLYEEASRFFPDFDSDLRAHLRTFATEETLQQIVIDRSVRASIEDWHIADMINGSRRCVGAAGASTMYSAAPEGAWLSGNRSSSSHSCDPDLPTNALSLLNAIYIRRVQLIREGRYGEVYTIDVPTDESGNEIRLQPAEAQPQD